MTVGPLDCEPLLPSVSNEPTHSPAPLHSPGVLFRAKQHPRPTSDEHEARTVFLCFASLYGLVLCAALYVAWCGSDTATTVFMIFVVSNSVAMLYLARRMHRKRRLHAAALDVEAQRTREYSSGPTSLNPNPTQAEMERLMSVYFPTRSAHQVRIMAAKLERAARLVSLPPQATRSAAVPPRTSDTKMCTTPSAHASSESPSTRPSELRMTVKWHRPLARAHVPSLDPLAPNNLPTTPHPLESSPTVPSHSQNPAPIFRLPSGYAPENPWLMPSLARAENEQVLKVDRGRMQEQAMLVFAQFRSALERLEEGQREVVEDVASDF